jgi:hypothetical protein
MNDLGTNASVCSGGLVTRGLVMRHPAIFNCVSKAAEQKDEVYLNASLLLALRGFGKLQANTVPNGGFAGVVIATCPNAVLEAVGMFVKKA